MNKAYPTAVKGLPLSVNLCPLTFTKPVAEGGIEVDTEVGTEDGGAEDGGGMDDGDVGVLLGVVVPDWGTHWK